MKWDVLEIDLAYEGSAYPDARWTTDHSASSYGIPVLVIGAEAYGAWDYLPNGMVARAWLRVALKATGSEAFRSGELPAGW